MTTTTKTRTCPQCGATLNRLTGHEGWATQATYRAPGALQHRSSAEWRAAAKRTDVRIAGPIFACPRCEHVEQ